MNPGEPLDLTGVSPLPPRSDDLWQQVAVTYDLDELRREREVIEFLAEQRSDGDRDELLQRLVWLDRRIELQADREAVERDRLEAEYRRDYDAAVQLADEDDVTYEPNGDAVLRRDPYDIIADHHNDTSTSDDAGWCL